MHAVTMKLESLYKKNYFRSFNFLVGAKSTFYSSNECYVHCWNIIYTVFQWDILALKWIEYFSVRDSWGHIDYEQYVSLFSVVRRAKCKTRKWPPAWLMARDALVSRVPRLRRSRALALLSLNLKKKRDFSQSRDHKRSGSNCLYSCLHIWVSTLLRNKLQAQTWGPFLDSPGNFTGPKSNIQIKI